MLMELWKVKEIITSKIGASEVAEQLPEEIFAPVVIEGLLKGGGGLEAHLSGGGEEEGNSEVLHVGNSDQEDLEE